MWGGVGGTRERRGSSQMRRPAYLGPTLTPCPTRDIARKTSPVDESEHPPPPSRADQPHGPTSDAPSEPALDRALAGASEPEVDARVRALLADTPDPGPMPRDVSDRIAAALGDEARLRVVRGPLPGVGEPPVADMAGPRGEVGREVGGGVGGSVTPLESRRRPRPWVAVAAVAAAAAVVAVGASALHVTQRPSPAAVVAGVTPTSTSPSAPADPHIQLSTTDYRASTFGAQARALIDHPATPLTDLAAESPSLGPIATPVGLASCLDALATGPGVVSLDLATFEGRPAAIIVVTRDGTSTAYAVERSCAPDNVTALAGATPVP